MAENHLDGYLREFGVCFQAIDKRFKSLGITCKKTFTYSEKREGFLTKIEQILWKNRVYVEE
jgi:hypothetical protein